MPMSLIVTLALLLGAALALGVAAAHSPYFPVDLRITRAVQQIGVTGFRALMIAVSWPGSDLHWLVISLLVSAVLAARHRVEAAYALGSAVGSWVLNNTLKLIIVRPRPSASLVEVYSARPTWSFPSGHVMSYVALYGFLFYLAYAIAPRSAWRTAALVLLGALVSLVGLSRIYLGAHWASDVLGGYLFGTVWLAVVISLYRSRAHTRA
jgi:undecaprenyl-diphosphatase